MLQCIFPVVRCAVTDKVTTIDLQVVECFGLFVCGGLTLFYLSIRRLKK